MLINARAFCLICAILVYIRAGRQRILLIVLPTFCCLQWRFQTVSPLPDAAMPDAQARGEYCIHHPEKRLSLSSRDCHRFALALYRS